MTPSNEREIKDIFWQFSNVKGTPDDTPLAVVTVKEEKALTPMHSHLFQELAIVVHGTGTYRTPSSTFQLAPGDVFMLKPGMAHEYSEQHHLTVANILFWPEKIVLPLYDLAAAPGYRAFFELEPHTREQYQFNGRLTLSMEQLEYLLGLIRRLEEELRDRNNGFLLMAISYLMQIFAHLCRCFSASTNSSHLELLRLEQVLAFMQKNYHREISRAELAKVAFMSESSLYRRFTQLLNKSPMQYLIDLRLTTAAEILQHSNDGIADIAAQCGFTDGNYFGLLFREHYGITPHQYRLKFHQRG